MSRSFLSTAALIAVFALCATTATAQTTFLNDDFSTAGALSSPNWSVFLLDISGTSANAGGQWRYDNPQLLAPTAGDPIVAPFAIADSDFAGSGTVYSTWLQSSAFDASGAAQVLLDVDWVFNDILGGETFALEAFDGSMWNVVNTFAGNDTNTGTLTSSTSQFDCTAALGGANNGRVRFAYENANWAWHAAVDNVNIFEPAPVDVAAGAVLSPVLGGDSCIHTLTATETIVFDWINMGSTALNPGDIINIAVDFDMVNVLNENDSPVVTINPLGKQTYTTLGTVDMSATGSHTLTVSATIMGDADTSNDTNSVAYTSPSSTPVNFGYSENFDSLPDVNAPFNGTAMPAGWINAQDDPASLGTHPSPDWGSIIGIQGNGPTGDHTSGSGTWIGIEDSTFGSGPGDVILYSPCLDTAGAVGAPTATFWNASDEDLTQYPLQAITLNIDVVDVTNGSVVTTSFVAIDGDGSDIAPITAGSDAAWRKISVDLSSFAPSIIRLGFRINNDNGSSGFYDDEGLDDFAFIDAVAPTGQAPQPGLAVFDMPGAINGLGNPVASGENGPYTANVAAGGDMALSWSSLPNAPMIHLFSPDQNTGVATFGPIGQLDIGSTTLIGGIPDLLFVLANGNGPYFPAGSLLNSFYFCNAAGNGGITLTVPGFLPPGLLTNFQMVSNPAGAFHISNAIVVNVM